MTLTDRLLDRLGTRRLGALVLVAFALLCTIAIWPNSHLPAPIRPGAKLAALVVSGQPALAPPGGLLVAETDGAWARIHVGENDRQGRWVHFAEVAAFSLPPADE